MPKKKGGHLTMADRETIEDMLNRGRKISEVARELGVCWDTVRDEVEGRRVRESDRFASYDRNTCFFKDVCDVRNVCRHDCAARCATCASACCNRVCERFEPVGECPKTSRAPYCCNGCRERLALHCSYPQWFYDAREADAQAREAALFARSGAACTPEQLEQAVAIVKPLLKKGQSLQHIWQTHHEELPVGWRTFYRYIELGLLDICNLELPRKVKYKGRARPQKKGAAPFRPNLSGRTYADFAALTADERACCVEMDCVVSGRGPETSSCILTLMWRRWSFQLMVLLERHTQQCVVEALDRVELALGAGGFARWLPVVLTDRGSEFIDWRPIERGVDGRDRCRVFYCDPLMSGQKGRCERNHVELRRVIPKGSDLSRLTEEELALACSHVNSYGRPNLGGQTPYALASMFLPRTLFEEFGIVAVPRDEVCLRPSLFAEAGLR